MQPCTCENCVCQICGRPYGKTRRCYYCTGRPRLVESCTVEGCETVPEARGLCSKHYQRWRTHGDPTVTNAGANRKPIGTKHVSATGYIKIKTEEGQAHWPLEHRHVMETFIGRKLTTDEHVHHINHDKTDNRLENLEVYTNSEHHKLHDMEAIKPVTHVNLICRVCGADYVKKRSRADGSTCCSKECRIVVMHEAIRLKAERAKRSKSK